MYAIHTKHISKHYLICMPFTLRRSQNQMLMHMWVTLRLCHHFCINFNYNLGWKCPPPKYKWYSPTLQRMCSPTQTGQTWTCSCFYFRLPIIKKTTQLGIELKIHNRKVHSNVIMHYDGIICTRSNVITHCDITIHVPDNTITHCDFTMYIPSRSLPILMSQWVAICDVILIDLHWHGWPPLLEHIPVYDIKTGHSVE